MSFLLLTEQSATPSTPSSTKVKVYADNTPTPRLNLLDDQGKVVPISPTINASVAAVSGGYASDTYLAGSAVTVPAGGWRVGQVYRLKFDMVKTNLGTATFIITVRMGTLGTTGDASIMTITFAAGTAAVDSGVFEVLVTFRTVGSGTSAVIQAVGSCSHHLAATGLISTGASGYGVIIGTSSGFNSTTQTILGVSVNGGASFSGTNTLVQAELIG